MPAFTVRTDEVPTGRAGYPGLSAAAWSPVPSVTPTGYGGGLSNAKAGGPKVLRPQDPPNAVPGGPLNPQAQTSVAYETSVGAVYGGGLSYLVANVPQAWQWKQRQEVDPPIMAANTPFQTPQAQRAPHVGGRDVTASPFIVQRWKVFGSGQ